MKKYVGFSLAEALITLLIVSIIAMVSAPILTKKAKKRPDEQPWTSAKQYGDAIHPNGGRNIILGSVQNGKPQSIVVVGQLEFKDRRGNTIGWINEDGSTSFSQGNDYDFNAMSQRQIQLEKTLETLSLMLTNEMQKKSSSSASYRRDDGASRRSGYSTRSSSKRAETQSNQPTQEELQRQIEGLMQMMQNQNNR